MFASWKDNSQGSTTRASWTSAAARASTSIRLARRGHRGHGIDFSPAAIDHARSVAAREELDCHFEQADLRHADFGEGFDLVLLIYGQINVFTRRHARDILQRAHAALAPGGTLLLEPQTPAAVRGPVDNTTDWTASKQGLFTSRPHVVLHERFWDEPSRTSTERWHVIDAETGAVDRHAMSSCSYDRDELMNVLRAVGFDGSSRTSRSQATRLTPRLASSSSRVLPPYPGEIVDPRKRCWRWLTSAIPSVVSPRPRPPTPAGVVRYRSLTGLWVGGRCGSIFEPAQQRRSDPTENPARFRQVDRTRPRAYSLLAVGSEAG